MRAEVMISESDDNPHKLYYKCPNKSSCGYFKWWVSEKDDFNNRAVFEGNLGAIVDCDTLNTIESNVKEVKTIVKKLQKSGFKEIAMKMMMYLNLAMFVLNFVMLNK